MNATPDRRIGLAVRGELWRQRITLKEAAWDVFGAQVWFMQSRCSGRTPFGAYELLQVADYLHVDVRQFLAAAKQPSPDDGAPPPRLGFHNGDASYDHSVADVVFNAPTALAAA